MVRIVDRIRDLQYRLPLKKIILDSPPPVPTPLVTLSSTESCNVPVIASKSSGTWPMLIDLGLAANQVSSRRHGIGGSDATTILSGNRDPVLRLWREKRGAREPDDLTVKLPVMLGSWTEAFNRQWYEKITGLAVTRVGDSVVCEEHTWRRCTIDGYVEELGAIWEAKHTSATAKPEDIITRYMPQLQHNMAVCKADRAILSVIFGNNRWTVFEVNAEAAYQEDLWTAEARFWDCVMIGRVPAAVRVPIAPTPVRKRDRFARNAGAITEAWVTNREVLRPGPKSR